MIAEFLSKAINQLLQKDAATKATLHSFEHKVITLECVLPIPLIMQCSVVDGQICIETGNKFSSDTTIKGTPLQLFRAGLLKFSSDAHQLDDLTIEGDIDLAAAWLRLLENADIDFEEALSHYTNDSIAHHTGNFVRRFTSSLTDKLNAFEVSVNDYLHEESDWFPRKTAFIEFFDDVDVIRLDTDRLAARIVILRQQIKDHS